MSDRVELRISATADAAPSAWEPACHVLLTTVFAGQGLFALSVDDRPRPSQTVASGTQRARCSAVAYGQNPATRPADRSRITRLQTDVCHDARMGYWQQFSLNLVSPLIGSALIGGMAAIITRRYQDRRLDRQFRMGLVSRLTDIVYKIHTDLSFYERWVRHSKPNPEERDTRREIVDQKFIAERTNLGALQAEIDAYFGENNTPGARLHRLTDLIMLRYAVILDVPQSQLMELVEHLGQPDHSGYTRDNLYDLLKSPKQTDATIWRPIKEIEAVFTVALHDALSALLETRPLSKTKGFNSTKLLTDADQRSAVPNLQPQTPSPQPMTDAPERA